MKQTLLAALAAALSLPGEPVPSTFDSTVNPFLKKNCIGCHNAKMKSGEVDLQEHAAKPLEDRDVWELVVQKVRSGEMPPKGSRKPKPDEVARVTGFIEHEYEVRDRNAKPDPGRVTARRLNRVEYNNTIRDLLEVQFRPADDFPADDSGYGFDNIGDVLSISPVLMEKYLSAAEKVSRQAIVAEPPQFRATRIQLKAESVKMGEHADFTLPAGAQGPLPSRVALHVEHRFPARAEYDIRIGMGGVRPPSAMQALKLGLWLDGALVKTYDVNPDRNKPRSFELRLPLEAGEHKLGVAILDDRFDPLEHEKLQKRDRYLAIDLIEVRGPYNAAAPPLPPSHRRTITCGHEINQHGASCARAILAPLARRAFRRTVADSEVDRLLGLVELARRDEDSFEQGIRLALQAILVSPHFLFRIERDPEPRNPEAQRRISEFELASRLSYFLWSSTPDDTLLNLAEQGRLRGQLGAQVRRMLSDPKASALAENFAGQWLQLRNLEETKPDPDRFPAFDDDLRMAMKKETELFFEAIAKEDRSILDFLDARFTFLNERLAHHYGIEGVEGPEFRRVALTGTPRAGVLTHASVLTVSSYPTRTSPVIRGKWVLENLLNAPPPPPPPGVPNLDEEAVGNTGSLRQQLEQHRTNPACASCHARMDPIGFGLENYDAIGAWRTQDGKFPIDAAGTLPNGKTFRSPVELVGIVKADKNDFAKCLTEKMLTYALGRGLERFDKPAVQSIQRKLASSQYRFSALVMGIVESLPFEMRRGEAPLVTVVAKGKGQ